jgi:hypothetical protein
MKYIDTIIIVTTVISAVYLQYRRDLSKNDIGHTSLKEDAEINAEIYPILWNLLTSIMGARRVAVTQFHNGGKFFSGNSINRMTMTHEVTRGTIAHVGKSIKEVIISRPYSITIDQVLEEKIAIYNDVSKIEDVDLMNYLKFMKATSACFVIMRDSKEQPIGLIHISSDEIDVFTGEIMEGIKMDANNIASVLEFGGEK